MKNTALALLLFVGVSARADSVDAKDEIGRAIANASSVAILSLEPNGPRDSNGACAGLCYFGWPVLGQTAATETAAKTIRHDLSAWASAPEPTELQMCFNPRHGVRLFANGHTYDFVVCFECARAEVYKDSSMVQFADFHYRANQADWDSILSSSGISLAAPAESDDE